MVGTNSRLDELQAGLLRVRLMHIEKLQKERQQICERYEKEILNTKFILSIVRDSSTTVWHQFVIRCKERDELIKYLNEHEIGTIIHYPIPPHLSEAYQYLGFHKGDYPITESYADEVLSLPLYNGMREDELTYVIEKLNQFR